MPILHYLDPNKRYLIYTDALDDTCEAQLLQEHNGKEFPIAFLSHTFTETQRKWSTTEQEAYGVYYAVTKWNCYLQGADIIVRNYHKPLAKFLNGKNTNNKVNRWGLEFATYNITFKWILGAKNKATDCLSRLVEQLPATPTIINLLTLLIQMDLVSTPEIELNRTLLPATPQYHQILHQTFPQSPVQHTSLLQQTDWKLYSRCRRLIHSVNAYLSDYLMEKHHNMKQTFSLISDDCCINT